MKKKKHTPDDLGATCSIQYVRSGEKQSYRMESMDITWDPGKWQACIHEHSTLAYLCTDPVHISIDIGKCR